MHLLSIISAIYCKRNLHGEIQILITSKWKWLSLRALTKSGVKGRHAIRNTTPLWGAAALVSVTAESSYKF